MKFIIQGCDEDLESNGGLALAGKILAGLNLDDRLNSIIIEDVLEPKITNADVVRSYFGLLVLGRTAYEDIEQYREVGYFRRSLGIKRVPSAETLPACAGHGRQAAQKTMGRKLGSQACPRRAACRQAGGALQLANRPATQAVRRSVGGVQEPPRKQGR